MIIPFRKCHSVLEDGGTVQSRETEYSYDAIGRLSTKGRQTIGNYKSYCSYTYDVHGWLKSVSSGGFREDLYYADGLDSACYNGNISTVKWKARNSNSYQGYNLRYDGCNRLYLALFGTGDNLTGNRNYFNEQAEYDCNGNITRLRRCGLQDAMHGGFGLVDDLRMTYEGNQLASVFDNVWRLPYTGATDFDGVAGQEYPLTYNGAGALVSDASRRIARIDYDLRNNPIRIQFTNGNVTRYVYSATGEKLRVIYQTAVPNITVAIGSARELMPSEILFTDSTDYLLGGALMLKNGRIDKYQFEEGYCQATQYNATQDNFTFLYYDRDHLGNVRQVTKASNSNGTVVQTMNYYPFGAQFCDGSATSDVQPYKYNGKELDKMHGLNTYDYGARQYYSILGRWDRIDPLCEKYYSISPYVYCANNPIRFVDKDGRIIRDSKDNIVYVSSGEYIHVKHASGIDGILEKGYIFTDNGQPIVVYNNNKGAFKGWDTDCHGYTFANGKYWINNDQVEQILKGDNYCNINLEQAKSGDIVVYYKNEEVEHSVKIVNSDGTLYGTIVYGLGGLETEAHYNTLPKGWNFNGEVLFEIYRKEQEDRVASEEEIEELQNKIH